MKFVNVYQIITLLFFWLLGVIMGGYYFYAVGHEDINDRLVLAAYNDGVTVGYLRGSTKTVYILFKEYIESNPYNVTDDMFKGENNE
jgi:soluble lytic murein transglycosylase-like protein